MGLAGSEPIEHIRDGNPHVTDARTAAALARLDGIDLLVVHIRKFSILLAQRSNVSPSIPTIARLDHRTPKTGIGTRVSLNGSSRRSMKSYVTQSYVRHCASLGEPRQTLPFCSDRAYLLSIVVPAKHLRASRDR